VTEHAAATAPEGETHARRPPVAVLLPFYGDAEDAREALTAISRLRLRPGDELVVADNTEAGVALDLAPPPHARALAVEVKRSAYAARNVAAEQSRADWLLFIDADCVPPADLLDRYFDSPPAADCGAVAGEVTGDPTQRGVVVRYVRSRGHLGQAAGRRHPYKPMAVTANLLVRREAWQMVGGFQEGTRSGADAEFCWRLQEAGWSVGLDTRAALVHRHRDRLGPLLRQAARDGAGAAWVERRRPGSGARPPVLRELARAAAGVVAWCALLQFERALFKAIDAVWVLATNAGYLTGNAPPDARGSDAGVIGVAATHPEQGAGAIERAGRVEAAARPERPAWRGGRSRPSAFAEDDGLARRALDLAWLFARHPLRCAADRRHGTRASRRETLAAIAPAVRRIVASPARSIVAGAGEDDVARAERIARLTGLPLEQR
jgi:hypothetical protein